MINHHKILLFGCLLPVLLSVSGYESQAELLELPVFRVQVGAYPTEGEAQAVLDRLTPELKSALRIVRESGSHPCKIQTGDYPSLAEARAVLKEVYAPKFFGAFVVTERLRDGRIPEEWKDLLLPSLQSDYQASLPLHPEWGISTLVENAQQASERRDRQGERAAWTELLMRFPLCAQQAEARFRLGRVYYGMYFGYRRDFSDAPDPVMQRRCLEEARRQFLQVVEEYPGTQEARRAQFFLGLTTYHLGDFVLKGKYIAEAAELIESASAQSPLDPWENLQYIGFRLELARNRRKVAEFEKVAELSDEYLARQGDASAEYRSRAAIMKIEATEEKLDYEGAVKLAGDLIEEYGGDPDCLLNVQRARFVRGRCLQKLGRSFEAEEDFALYTIESASSGIALSATHHQEIATRAGLARELAGFPDEAEQWYRQAIRPDGDPRWSEVAYAYLFDLYLRQGDLGEAHQVAAALAELNPRSTRLGAMDRALSTGQPVRSVPRMSDPFRVRPPE